MAERGVCPWCRRPIEPGAPACPHCGYKLRDEPRAAAPRAEPGQEPSRVMAWLRAALRKLRPLATWQALVAALVLLAPLVAWHVATREVRGELAAVEAYLEAQPQLRNVRVAKPLLATSLPDSVSVSATAIPPGYPSEVTVPTRGEYDTRTRQVVLTGRRQIFFPYEMINIRWPFEVPPAER